jgi:5,10-methenyltetrahydrofolate synthetase
MKNKTELRKIKIAERNELSDSFVEKASKQICDRIISLEEYKKADVILGYFSARNEVRLDNIFQEAIGSGKRVYLPKVISKTEMKFYRFMSEQDLVPGHFGIMEPAAAECFELGELTNGMRVLMIMPCVAFDNEGNRLGYGGGYYDRYLSEAAEIKEQQRGLADENIEFTTIAAAYEMQRVEQIPVIDTDIKPDRIICEKIYEDI